MAFPGTQDKCKTCKTACSDPKAHLTDKKGLRCTVCNSAYHWECEGVSKEDFAKFKSMSQNMYTCKSCRTATTPNRPSTSGDDARILAKLETLIDQLLDKKLEKIESSINAISSRLSAIEKHPTTGTGNLAELISKEVTHALRRERSVIINGIKESMAEDSQTRQIEDKTKIEKVINSMNMSTSFSSHFRLGKRIEGKSRPIKITVMSPTDVKDLIESSRKIRPVLEDRNVFFNHDMTDLERKQWKEYREYKKTCVDGSVESFGKWLRKRQK